MIRDNYTLYIYIANVSKRHHEREQIYETLLILRNLFWRILSKNLNVNGIIIINTVTPQKFRCVKIMLQ